MSEPDTGEQNDEPGAASGPTEGMPSAGTPAEGDPGQPEGEDSGSSGGSSLAEQFAQLQAAARAKADTGRAGKVAAAFKALDKSLRAMRMYNGEGVMVDRLLAELDATTEEMLKEGGATVRITARGLEFEGENVSPSEKRLPYLFRLFADGVRELSVLPGMERREWLELIDVLTLAERKQAEAARHKAEEAPDEDGADAEGGDPASSTAELSPVDTTASVEMTALGEGDEADEDLVTLLWKRDLPHLRPYVVDTFVSGQFDQQDQDLSLATGGSGNLARDGSGQELQLSSDDVRMLRNASSVPWLEGASAPAAGQGREARVVAPIRQAYKSPHDTRRFIAIAIKAAMKTRRKDEERRASPLVLNQFETLIGAAELDDLAEMLEVVGGLDGKRHPEIALLRKEIAAPERIKKMAPLVRRHHTKLMPLLAKLLPEGRQGLVALLTRLRPGPPQSALREVLLGSGADLTPYYIARLDVDDVAEVVDAVRALGEIGSQEALEAIAGQLGHSRTEVRHVCLEKLQGHYLPTARVELGRALRDPLKDCRMLALAILAGSGDKRMGGRLVASVEDSNFLDKDDDEQEALYEALAGLKDNRTLGHFKKVFEDKNLIRDRGIVRRQLLAARALPKLGTEQAAKLVAEFQNRWYHARPVKEALSAALNSMRRA